jgi:hypothetical protein
MGSYKGDIQATRIGAATSNVIIAPPVRLPRNYYCRFSNFWLVELKTTSATGATLFTADVPAGDVIIFHFQKMEFYFQKVFMFQLLLLHQLLY